MPYRVLVVGAGNAGISLAARLVRDGFEHVTVCDSRPVHRYRPLLNYVGAGMVDQAAIGRPMSGVVPDRVRLVTEDVVSVDLSARIVTTAAGQRIEHDILVLATGLDVDHDAVPGLRSAYDHGWAVSTFVDETASAVWNRVRALTAGTAVFTVPPEPAPCAATALKPLLMACDHWRRTGVLDALRVHLVVPGDRPLPAGDGPNRTLERQLADFGVIVHRACVVTGVDHDARTITVGGTDGQEIDDVQLAHVVPHYRAPSWIAGAGLAGPDAGRADVDPQTLRHPRHPSVWALGDVADLGMPPSGGALRKQVDVLARNLAADDDTGFERYDGYTVMPVTLDRRRLMLVEVDRTGRPAPTTRLVDLTKPRRSTFWFDRFGLPQVYWRRILRGLT